MLLRALVVLLLILNLGVSTWWATRGAPDGPPAVVLPDDVARLQLAGEAALPTTPGHATASDARPSPASTSDADTVPADAALVAATAPVAAAPLAPAALPQCHALGPFADVASRDAARALLAPLVVRTAARDVAETPRGWRVWMAPLAERSDVDAVVTRLVAAGFSDYYVMTSGDEANGIALGRFGSEAGAESRAGALRAAGFDVETAPLGSVIVRHWLDVMAADGATGASLRAQAAAARAEPRDCNAIGEAG